MPDRRLLLVAAACLAANAAKAETRHLEAKGASLAIASPCARTVVIQPDPSLSGSYILDARADHEQETARLVFEGGTTAKLHVSTPACQGSFPGGSGDSTLDLTLRVPPGTTLAVGESGGARYTIGAVGKLTLDLSGGVHLQAASARDVALSLSGGAALQIGSSSGDMTVDLSGGGDIRIDHATLSRLALSLSGAGAFTLTDGSIGPVTLDVSGAGSVHIGAPVTDATIDLSGVGDVHLAQVTGKLTKANDGLGSIEIGKP